MKISAIYFDLGKVLLHFDWDLMLDRIAEKSKLPKDEIRRRLFEDPQTLAYELGGISSAIGLVYLAVLVNLLVSLVTWNLYQMLVTKFMSLKTKQ